MCCIWRDSDATHLPTYLRDPVLLFLNGVNQYAVFGFVISSVLNFYIYTYLYFIIIQTLMLYQGSSGHCC